VVCWSQDTQSDKHVTVARVINAIPAGVFDISASKNVACAAAVDEAIIACVLDSVLCPLPSVAAVEYSNSAKIRYVVMMNLDTACSADVNRPTAAVF